MIETNNTCNNIVIGTGLRKCMPNWKLGHEMAQNLFHEQQKRKLCDVANKINPVNAIRNARLVFNDGSYIDTDAEISCGIIKRFYGQKYILKNKI